MINHFFFFISNSKGYPLAVFYHKSGVFNLSKNLNHLFFAICGLIICYFNYGIEVYHSVIAVIASYLFIQFLGRTKYLIPVTFIFHMTHLLGGKYIRQFFFLSLIFFKLPDFIGTREIFLLYKIFGALCFVLSVRAVPLY